MNEIALLDGVPVHPVLGENLHGSLLVAVALVSLLMAAAATWLVQEEMVVRPASASTQPLAPIEPVKSALDEALIRPKTSPAMPASAAALPASKAEAPKDDKPACPEMVSIFFPVGASVPQAESDTSELTIIVDWAKSNPGAKIAVEGYADVVGLDQANLILSYERAKTVASLLAKRGIALQQVQIAAAGNHSLVEGLPGDAQANRRVSVHINDPDGCHTTSR